MGSLAGAATRVSRRGSKAWGAGSETGCDTGTIRGLSCVARAGVDGRALAWAGFWAGLSACAVPAGSSTTARPSGSSSMRYPTFRVSSTTTRVMPTRNWLLRTSRTGSVSDLRMGLFHVYVVPWRSMTRRSGESMKLDWYFVGPLVLIRTATSSATLSTLTDETCTLASGTWAVPMLAMTAVSSQSTPTICTMGFIRRSPLPRISIRMSIHDQAQGHRRGPLARLSSHCKGYGRTRDAGHPAVAETIAPPQDVADTIRPFDEGERVIRTQHDADQLRGGDVDALALAGQRHGRERIAAALGVVGHRRQRAPGPRIERPHGGRTGRWRRYRCCGRRWRLGRRGGRLGSATTPKPRGEREGTGHGSRGDPAGAHRVAPPAAGAAGGAGAGVGAAVAGAPGLAGGGAPSGLNVYVASVISARSVPGPRSTPIMRNSPRETMRGISLTCWKKVPIW